MALKEDTPVLLWCLLASLFKSDSKLNLCRICSLDVPTGIWLQIVIISKNPQNILCTLYQPLRHHGNK